MKRLLLVIGMVGCGGGDTSPTGESANPVDQFTRDSAGQIVGADFRSNGGEDEDLLELKEMTTLKHLLLGGSVYQRSSVSDAGLAHLSGLTHLETLEWSFTTITGEGLEHLRTLVNLRSLAIQDSWFTDDGLVHIKELPALQDLRLVDTKISDEGLVQLKELASLERLWLTRARDSGRGIGATGLVHLIGHTGLWGL